MTGLVSLENDFSLCQGCIHREAGNSLLQKSYSASFVFNPLFIPFPQDCRQVFLDSHLFPVAAVAVREDSVRVALGERLRVFVVFLLRAAAYVPTARKGVDNRVTWRETPARRWGAGTSPVPSGRGPGSRCAQGRFPAPGAGLRWKPLDSPCHPGFPGTRAPRTRSEKQTRNFSLSPNTAL